MATLETAEGTAKGLRQVIQDLITPDLRELKADVRNIKERLDRMDQRMDHMDSRFDRLEQMMMASFDALRRQLDTYNDVQVLKERMARMEGERSTKPAA